MLSTKNCNNNSSIFANTAKFNKLDVDTINIGNFSEIGLIRYIPFGFDYVLDYNLSNKFYIKTYDVGLIGYNYNLIIKNVPTDFNIYTLSLLTYNFYPIYCNLLKVIDTEGNYILGSATAYETPFFSNGIPSLNAGPCIIVQEFSIVPIYREYSLIPIKYVLSNVKSNYTTASDIYNIFYTKTEIDTNYYNKTQSDTNYPTFAYINTNYYIKTDVDGKIATSYNNVMDRLDNFHYTISQSDATYYNKTYVDSLLTVPNTFTNLMVTNNFILVNLFHKNI